jgi:hypothetical protein
MRFVDLLVKYHALFIVALIGLLHAPFIFSDPDTQVSPISRGAWTDEGLNTIQVRNFVNHGYLSMDECDNLVKTPYFGFILVPFYSLLGTHIWVGRLLILACVLVTLFVFIRNEDTKLFGIVLGILGLLEFHVFHYSHYSMAEMLAISWILLGIFLHWYAKQKDSNWWFVASAACFSLTYYSKVTFAYAVIIPFATCFAQLISDRVNGKQTTSLHLKNLALLVSVTAFFGSAFYLKWYLPNESVFDMVYVSQGQGRYDTAEAWERFKFNLDEFILVEGIKPFIMLVPIVLMFLIRTKFENEKQILFFSLIAWLVLELHHTILVNPPTRYLLSVDMACLAVVSFGLTEAATSGFKKALALVGFLILGGYNLYHYWDSLNRRTFQIESVYDYLSNYDLKDRTILGVWSATLASETQARCIPIWSEFNPRENPLAEFNPPVIFSEHDEAESDEFYQNKGISLEAESDSVRQFDVWRFKVNAFWTKAGQDD